MAALASEWGFQGFGAVADYPTNEAAPAVEPGSRAKKTDKKRQRQLEELVMGVIRLDPMPAGAATAAQPEARSVTTEPAGGKRSSGQPAASAPAPAQPPTADATEAQPPTKKRRSKNKFKPDPPAGACEVEQVPAKQPQQAVAAAAQPQQPAGKNKHAKIKLKAANALPAQQSSEQAAAQPGSAPAPAADAVAAVQRPPGKRKRRAQRLAAEAAAAAALVAAAAGGTVPSNSGTADAAVAAAAAEDPAAGTDASGGAASAKKKRKKAAAAGKPQEAAAVDEPSSLTQKQMKKVTGQQQAAAPAAEQDPAALQQAAELPGLSSKQKEQAKRQQRQQLDETAVMAAEQKPAATPAPGTARPAAGGGLLDKMRSKLQGGRFRFLNEQLYTSSGNAAFRMMQEQPDLYSQYHEGFRRQAADWPQQPVSAAIDWLKAKPKDWVVADFGCGDAQLAAQAAQRVHSFDLVAGAPGVTACNMAAVPLPDASVHAAVFCIALMGTDYGSFLQEAHRVLKDKGWLWICEVRSRFAGQSSSGGGEAPVADWVMVNFTKRLQHLGFKLAAKKVFNKMFVVFELRKQKAPVASSNIAWPALKGCVYKKQ